LQQHDAVDHDDEHDRAAEHLDHDDEHDRAAEHDHHDDGSLTGRPGPDRFL
jgi:hypothetical protein